MTSRMPARLAVIAVIIVAVFASGITAAWLWFLADPPTSLASAQPATEAPVGYREYTDTRAVTLRVDYAGGSTLESGLAGRITSSECAPGAVVESGSILASIDGRPVVALATSVPLWRDLREGDRGDDVRSLQTELRRLGYAIVADGVVGARSLIAFADLVGSAGERPPGLDTVDVGRIVWLPSQSVTIGECRAHTGSRLEAGETIASVAERVTRVSLTEPLPELTGVQRNVTVDSVTVPLETGAVIEQSALDRLSTTPSFAHDRDGRGRENEREAGGARSISATVEFAKPLVVGVVPPSSVYAITGSAGCVATARGPAAVTIVGSQLGQTFILFTKGDKPAKVRLPYGEPAPCA